MFINATWRNPAGISLVVNLHRIILLPFVRNIIESALTPSNPQTPTARHWFWWSILVGFVFVLPVASYPIQKWWMETLSTSFRPRGFQWYYFVSGACSGMHQASCPIVLALIYLSSETRGKRAFLAITFAMAYTLVIASGLSVWEWSLGRTFAFPRACLIALELPAGSIAAIGFAMLAKWLRQWRFTRTNRVDTPESFSVSSLLECTLIAAVFLGFWREWSDGIRGGKMALVYEGVISGVPLLSGGLIAILVASMVLGSGGATRRLTVLIGVVFALVASMGIGNQLLNWFEKKTFSASAATTFAQDAGYMIGANLLSTSLLFICITGCLRRLGYRIESRRSFKRDDQHGIHPEVPSP